MKFLILILSVCFLLVGCCASFPKKDIVYMAPGSQVNPPRPVVILKGQLDKNLKGKSWVTLETWKSLQSTLRSWEKEYDEKYKKPPQPQLQEGTTDRMGI